MGRILCWAASKGIAFHSIFSNAKVFHTRLERADQSAARIEPISFCSRDSNAFVGIPILTANPPFIQAWQDI